MPMNKKRQKISKDPRTKAKGTKIIIKICKYNNTRIANDS